MSAIKDSRKDGLPKITVSDGLFEFFKSISEALAESNISIQTWDGFDYI